MKPEPERMDWDKVQEEVVRATKKILISRYVNVKYICREIMNAKGKYPVITGKSSWHPEKDVTDRTVRCRAIVAISQMGWQPRNNGKARGTGRVFIVPWVPEDPVLAGIQQEGRATEP